MSDDLSAAEAELLTEGMTSYWDAKFALDVFEQKIQEVANRVLNENLNKVRVAFGLEEIPESHRWPLGETCEEGRVVLGGGYGWRSERAWEANMRFGVGWMPETAGKPRRGFLGIEICEGSQWKIRSISRALRVQSNIHPIQDIRVYDWPEHARFVLYSVLENPSEDRIKGQLSAVLDCFVEWCCRAGGLNNLLYPPESSAPSA